MKPEWSFQSSCGGGISSTKRLPPAPAEVGQKPLGGGGGGSSHTPLPQRCSSLSVTVQCNVPPTGGAGGARVHTQSP